MHINQKVSKFYIYIYIYLLDDKVPQTFKFPFKLDVCNFVLSILKYILKYQYLVKKGNNSKPYIAYLYFLIFYFHSR